MLIGGKVEDICSLVARYKTDAHWWQGIRHMLIGGKV